MISTLLVDAVESGSSDFRIALVGLGGALIGALIGFGGVLIQTWAASAAERRSSLRTLYADFLKAHETHTYMETKKALAQADIDELLIERFGRKMHDFKFKELKPMIDNLSPADQETFKRSNRMVAEKIPSSEDAFLNLSSLNQRVQVQGSTVLGILRRGSS